MWQALNKWWYDKTQHPNLSHQMITNPKPSMDKIYWFECIGMFIFVFLQTCTKQPTGIHLQITLILMIAIPMCAKISGAHYNPAVTISNYMCRFNHNKFGTDVMWMYFKGQVYAAVFALGLGYVLNDRFLAGLAVPGEEVYWWRILMSQMLATGILVFYTQLTANSETSFAGNDGQRYCFIIAFVFVARKSAYVSSFAINPEITIATVVLDIITCRFLYLHICLTYILGDIIGSILGTLLYNTFYTNNLHYSRANPQTPPASRYDVEMQVLVSPNALSSEDRIESTRQEQSAGYSRNFIQLERVFGNSGK